MDDRNPQLLGQWTDEEKKRHWDYYREALEKAMLVAAPRKEGHAPKADYGHPLDSWVFGVQSVVTMLWIKVKRIVNLTLSGRQAACESKSDSAMDLINYAAFCYAFWKLEEDREQEEMCICEPVDIAEITQLCPVHDPRVK